MSFVEDKKLITDALKAIGYIELPANRDIINEPAGSHKHKSYTLKPLGLRTEFLTSLKTLNEVKAELVIRYIGMKPADYDSNFDLFNTALTTIKDLHSGYSEDPEYILDEKNNYESYGVVNFILGVKQC